MPPPTRSSGALAAGEQRRGAARCPRGRVGCAGPATRNVVGSITKVLGGEIVLGRGRHPPGRRATPGPAGPRSRPRRRGAPVRESRLVSSTRISSLTAGRRISACRHSCVMFFQECARLVSPAIATIGTSRRSALRSSRCTRLVAPGPSVPSQMPGPVGDPRIGVGGEGAAALVVDQEMPHAELSAAHRRTARAETRPSRTSARPRRAAASRRARGRRSYVVVGSLICSRFKRIPVMIVVVAPGPSQGRRGRCLGRTPGPACRSRRRSAPRCHWRRKSSRRQTWSLRHRSAHCRRQP